MESGFLPQISFKRLILGGASNRKGHPLGVLFKAKFQEFHLR